MSKWSKVISLFAVLFILLGAFATPALAGNKATNMVLAGSYYVVGKGPVFVFSVNGTVAGLGKVSLVTSQKTFRNLNCAQADASTVKCSAPKNSAGLNGTLYVGDFAFWVSVPQVRMACYGVHDINRNWEWVQFDTYCQEHSAKPGDQIYHYNEEWGFSYWYIFLTEGVPGYNQGEAYYWNSFPVAD